MKYLSQYKPLEYKSVTKMNKVQSIWIIQIQLFNYSKYFSKVWNGKTNTCLEVSVGKVNTFSLLLYVFLLSNYDIALISKSYFSKNLMI